MKLPEEIARRLAGSGGQTSPTAARALYDLEGNLGETWAATDGQTLLLLSKRIGGEPKLTQIPLGAVDDLHVRDDGAFAYLQWQAQGTATKLKFSIWDRHDLDTICAAWANATGNKSCEGTRHLQLDSVGSAHPSAAPLTPLVAFCTAIHGMIRADGQADPVELFVLQTAVHDPDAIAHGRLWLETHGEAELLKHLPGLLNDEQKICLLANAAAVGLEDGLWRTSEQTWLEQLRGALGVSEADFQPVLDVLLIQQSLSVFESDSGALAGPASPLSLFAASLQAMAEADGGVGQDEQTLLWLLVDEPELASQAAGQLQREGLAGVIRHAGLLLTDPQKHCLLANLLRVAMVDGVLRSREQSLLETFRLGLGVAEGTWQAIHHALLVKNNLTVFGL